MPQCYDKRNTMSKRKFSPYTSRMSEVATTEDVRAQQARAVIDKVAAGMLLQDACNQHDITPQSFARVLVRLRDLAVSYAEAQNIAADLMIDDALRIADSDVNPKKARNQMQMRQWAASKRAPKTYGDRLELSMQATISITEALTESRARLLRPVSDQQLIEDAQVVDSQAISLPAPRDEASQQQDEPDIFS